MSVMIDILAFVFPNSFRENLNVSGHERIDSVYAEKFSLIMQDSVELVKLEVSIR